MFIIYCAPEGEGWSPIHRMVSLAAELFAAELIVFDEQNANSWQRLAAFLWRRGRAARDADVCLMVCPSPANLSALLKVSGWRHRFRRLVAWVIDSFWVERIPRLIRWSCPFDELFVTTEEDIPTWERLTKTRTSWLPWGADVLRQGGWEGDRPWDVIRIGRQPPEWRDDEANRQMCAAHGLSFHGRLPTLEDAQANQESVLKLYREAKFLLAFSNKANPMPYTHPTREYLTGRWVDSLACGTTVAGIAPQEPSIRRLLWPGATLELGSVQRAEGLEVLVDAVQDWQPLQAENNYRQSLEHLDWRWRFAQIATALGVQPSPLQNELMQLQSLLCAS